MLGFIYTERRLQKMRNYIKNIDAILNKIGINSFNILHIYLYRKVIELERYGYIINELNTFLPKKKL